MKNNYVTIRSEGLQRLGIVVGLICWWGFNYWAFFKDINYHNDTGLFWIFVIMSIAVSFLTAFAVVGVLLVLYWIAEGFNPKDKTGES